VFQLNADTTFGLCQHDCAVDIFGMGVNSVWEQTSPSCRSFIPNQPKVKFAYSCTFNESEEAARHVFDTHTCSDIDCTTPWGALLQMTTMQEVMALGEDMAPTNIKLQTWRKDMAASGMLVSD
jgi:hypothetical protein